MWTTEESAVFWKMCHNVMYYASGYQHKQSAKIKTR